MELTWNQTAWLCRVINSCETEQQLDNIFNFSLSKFNTFESVFSEKCLTIKRHKANKLMEINK